MTFFMKMDKNANKASGRPVQAEGQSNRPTHGAVDSKFVNGHPQVYKSNNGGHGPTKFEGNNNKAQGVDLMQKVYGSNASKLKPKAGTSGSPMV